MPARTGLGFAPRTTVRRAWLRRVALNLAGSSYRRRRAEWRANRRHGEPTARIEETAVSLAVREAVASLPPRQRTFVALRFFVGLDVAQTATVMSIDERPAELGSPKRALTGPRNERCNAPHEVRHDL